MAMGASELALHRLDVDEQGGVTTDALVDSLRVEQSRRLDELAAEPTFAIVQSRAREDGDPLVQARNRANDSYANQLIHYGRWLGIEVDHAVFDNDFAAANHIRQLNRKDETRRTITPILPLLPGQTAAGSQYIAEIMLPEKDPDSTAPKGNLYVPATAEAMLLTAEAMVGLRVDRWQSENIKVGYVGYGSRTIQPLNEQLIRGQAEVAVALRTKAEIDAIDTHAARLRACDVIFTGVPKACALRAEHISEGTAIVDVGQGPHPETGKTAGNLDESVFTIRGIRATRLRRGVGPVTTAIMYDRVVAMHEAAQPDPHPSAPVALRFPSVLAA